MFYLFDKVKHGKHFSSSNVNSVVHAFKICTKMMHTNNKKIVEKFDISDLPDFRISFIQQVAKLHVFYWR